LPDDVRACFVDASSGRVLLDFSTRKPGQPADAHAASSDASGSPALAASRSAIDAVRRYYEERTGGFALDDAAEPVHVVARPWADASASRSLIARDLAYAVLDRLAALTYRRESGALADAYADLVAASVAAASDGGPATDSHDPWMVGEPASAEGIRSLRDPARLGSPDHYSAIDAGTDMHASSTVASHAFYLAIEGGPNRTSGLEVEGVGGARRDQVERAFLRAFMFMLPASATFSTAREATVQSARDLYGPASEAARAIGQAWAAVGVR
jgi:Zn-dependent metalloprotease